MVDLSVDVSELVVKGRLGGGIWHLFDDTRLIILNGVFYRSHESIMKVGGLELCR